MGIGKRVAGLGALALWIAGCGASTDVGSSTRTGGASSSKSKSSAASSSSGGSGSAGSSSPSGTSNFGNSNSTPQASTPRDGGVVGDGGQGPDQGGCGNLEVMAMTHMTEKTTMVETKVPGNLLIVFDKSGSMKDIWSGTDSKWTAATNAITLAVTALQNDIAMAGAIFFPMPDACSVDAINSGSQIDWTPGPQFVQAWGAWIGAHGPGGSTPTDDAARQADTALLAELPMLTGTTAVLFITDGDPTCGTANAAVAQQLLGSWLANYSVKTYVVGLPGTSINGQNVLTSLAVAGGTTTYTSPNDPMALQTLLSQIVTSSVSTMTMTMTTTSLDCTITLPKKPPNTDDVTLVVTQKGMKQQVARDLGGGAGWTINADGTEIILQGAFCTAAQMGQYDGISVAFGCVDYPPLPPPKVQ